jgi:hypothetical protein
MIESGQRSVAGGGGAAGHVTALVGVFPEDEMPAPKRWTSWHRDSLVTVGGALGVFAGQTTLFGYIAVQTGAADGDEFTTGFFVRAGTYTMRISGRTQSSAGIADWRIDGVLVAAGDDWHSGVQVNSVSHDFAVTIATDGWHELRGRVNGQAPGSTGFQLPLTVFSWIPAADA